MNHGLARDRSVLQLLYFSSRTVLQPYSTPYYEYLCVARAGSSGARLPPWTVRGRSQTRTRRTGTASLAGRGAKGSAALLLRVPAHQKKERRPESGRTRPPCADKRVGALRADMHLGALRAVRAEFQTTQGSPDAPANQKPTQNTQNAPAQHASNTHNTHTHKHTPMKRHMFFSMNRTFMGVPVHKKEMGTWART
jgi:hypothetical protein